MTQIIIRLNCILLLTFISIHANAEVKDSLLITQLGAKSLEIVYNNPDSARRLIDEALTLSHRNKHNGLLGLTYNYLGIYHDVVGDNDSAFIAYNTAVGYAKKQQNKTTLAASYNNMGLLHWNLHQLTEASEFFFKAAEIY